MAVDAEGFALHHSGGPEINDPFSDKPPELVSTKKTRLGTQGYGESSPRDANDTLEGRARNRRVELMRQP